MVKKLAMDLGLCFVYAASGDLDGEGCFRGIGFLLPEALTRRRWSVGFGC